MVHSNFNNRSWVLVSYPESLPQENNFRFDVDQEIPEVKENEILVKASYLSVDPYMRGRISPSKGYTAGVELGGLMPAGGVGTIIESRADQFKPGDEVLLGNFGWQEYAVVGAEMADKVDTNISPIQS